jgi:hypothetical protein
MFVLLVAWSCSPSQKAVSSGKKPIIKIDSTEYEIIVIDPEFDHWYLLNFSITKDRSNEYYRSKNQLGVNNWNDYFIRNLYPNLIDSSIVYDFSVDYGIDVNRTLYWYFKYYEDTFGIRLLH